MLYITKVVNSLNGQQKKVQRNNRSLHGETIFSEQFSIHDGFTLSLLLLILALHFPANSLISALYSVVAWVKWCFHMQCCLVFSAPALNLVVALFQPRWGHLLTIWSGNVAITNLRVKIMGVVSATKVSNIFPIPQDTFQSKQAHLVVNSETDFLFPCSLFSLGFQGGPAEEVSVSLQFTGEKESSLQWCVVHPHLLVPVRVALLNAETIDGAVAGVHHSKLLASLSQRQVYRNTAVTWNVQLPTKLPNKANPQCSYLMTRNLDHLVGGEREAEIVQWCVGQLLKYVPGSRALKAEHPHLLAPVLQCHVETPILNGTLDVGKVLVGGTASGGNVEAATLEGRISTGTGS